MDYLKYIYEGFNARKSGQVINIKVCGKSKEGMSFYSLKVAELIIKKGSE